MTDHDPLCYAEPDYRPCVCDLIAKARADERERIAQAIENASERRAGSAHD